MTLTNRVKHSNGGGSRGRRWLCLFLRGVAAITLLAFAAAVMPADWIVEIAEELGFEPFPDSPLTFYLARHLSLLYGCIGVLLSIVATDLDRYRPLIGYLAWGTVALGILQLWIDWQSALPLWWTLTESVSTILGGVIFLWLVRRFDAGATEPS